MLRNLLEKADGRMEKQPPMEPEKLDLKKTVNLPRTDFPMKADLPESEPKSSRAGRTRICTPEIRDARAGRTDYVLHDGPPYANGNIHLGHAFNKILKDFIVKSKTMAGFDAPYVPGWDCHGLPIEIKVDSELGPKKAQMTPPRSARACRKYAAEVRRSPARGFQASGRLRPLGRSVSHHEPRLRGGRSPAPSSTSSKKATSTRA